MEKRRMMEEKKYLFCGDREYLTAQLEVWEGLLEQAAAFYDGTEHSGTFMGKPIMSLKEIREAPDLMVCIASKHVQQEFFQWTEKGIDSTRLYDLNDRIRMWEKENKIRPAAWRILKENVRPEKIRLELCTLCQLCCATCYMRHGCDEVYGNGYLRCDTFQKILDQNPFIKEIEICNNGEVFLNPEFEEILEYAYKKGVKMTAEGGANFNDVRDSQIEAMVKYELQDLIIAADGATNETYTLYRRKGNIEKVFENIRKLIKVKEQYHSLYPRIHWQYIIMESSEPDLEKAKEIAKELGIDIRFKLTWDRHYVPKNPHKIRELTGLAYLTLEEYEKETGKPYGPGHPICQELFDAPRVNWDGRLFGCCAQHNGDLGCNVLDGGLEKALKSPAIVYARKMLCGQMPEAEDEKTVPCVKCHSWHQMKKNNWRFCLEESV